MAASPSYPYSTPYTMYDSALPPDSTPLRPISTPTSVPARGGNPFAVGRGETKYEPLSGRADDGVPGARTDYPPHMARTPSPTQSEYNLLHGIKEKRSTKDTIIRYAVIGLLVGILVTIMLLKDQIVDGLKPVTDWLVKNKVLGPFIIILIYVIISFPPLFGHEILSLLVGVTWSLPVAFVIVGAGTLIGETANFFVFKYACGARAAKMEREKLSLALLIHVVRQGGFLMVLVVRYSAIPPHFATLIFSTSGMSFLTFIGAAFLSLPKAFVPVYMGYAMESDNDRSTMINRIIIGVTIGITILAIKYIDRQQEKVKGEVVYARQKARQAKILRDAQGTVPLNRSFEANEV